MSKLVVPVAGYFYKNVGYGMTTYERQNDEFIMLEGDKLFTSTFDSMGLEWDDRTKLWKFDSGLGLGLVTYIVPHDDPAALAYLEKYGDD